MYRKAYQMYTHNMWKTQLNNILDSVYYADYMDWIVFINGKYLGLVRNCYGCYVDCNKTVSFWYKTNDNKGK